MDGNAYFQSLTSEIGALRDRIRHFIGDAHWPTDGKWKEGVLRTVLRRHLPATVGIGTGFIVSNKGVSTENDILLYDTAQPLLFHDGDLVILTPDAVLGLIEVKTKLPNSEHAIYEMLNKLADNIELASTSTVGSCGLPQNRFFGIFSYGGDRPDATAMLKALQRAVGGNFRRVINALSVGESTFVRFWHCPPERPNMPAPEWHSYNLDVMAPAFFIHNVIEHICPSSVWSNDSVWSREFNAEGFKVGAMPLRSAAAKSDARS